MQTNRPKQTDSTLSKNTCQTLPITCQICLGRVRDPRVCSNLHAFCSNCINIWLEKIKSCPSCRVPINQENPCRPILGGAESIDDVDFSHLTHIRKARYLNLFEQYEDEISRLLNYIDSLHLELSKYREPSKTNVLTAADTINRLERQLQQIRW